MYIGNGLWKYFPTELYKNYAQSEEKMYDIIVEIVKKSHKDEEFLAEDGENFNFLSTIWKNKELDGREKISGLIGELLLSLN